LPIISNRPSAVDSAAAKPPAATSMDMTAEASHQSRPTPASVRPHAQFGKLRDVIAVDHSPPAGLGQRDHWSHQAGGVIKFWPTRCAIHLVLHQHGQGRGGQMA
jgi:hypothetical protein